MLKLNYLKCLLLAVWMITGLFAEFSLIQHILIEYLLWSICTLLKYMYTSWTEGKYLDWVHIFLLVVNTSTKNHIIFYEMTGLLRILLATEMLPYECLSGLFSSCSCVCQTGDISLHLFVGKWSYEFNASKSPEGLVLFSFKCRFQACPWNVYSLEIQLLSVWWRRLLDFVIKNSCLGLPIFDWAVCCFYILEINPLSVASFANIFSHSVGCLFVFVYGFLCCAKALKFH